MILAQDVLFYPYIDIFRSQWLRTAILTWDSITTIVPRDYVHPYRTYDSSILSDYNILKPYYVDNYSEEVKITASNLSDYSHTEQWIKILKRSKKFQEEKFTLYTGKMTPEVKDFLISKLGAQKINTSAILVTAAVASLYMTLLATTIAHRTSQSMWGETNLHRSLANNYSIYTNSAKTELGNRYQTLLATYALSSIHISATTPIQKIIAFREKYKDERRRFRIEINRLSETLQQEYESPEHFRSTCEIIYKDYIAGAVTDLKKALTQYKIDHGVSILSWFALAPTIALLGSIKSLNIISAASGIGISAGLQYIRYNKDKTLLLQQSPYSYVLFAENEFK